MRKMYNIGELVEIKQEKVIGHKYGTIHDKYRSLSTGKHVYTVLVPGESNDMISFGKPLCVTLDHDDLLSPRHKE